MGRKPKVIEEGFPESKIDRIIRFIKDSGREHLDFDDMEYLKQLERCRDLLVNYNHNTATVIKMLFDEYQFDKQKIYNILNDCKAIYGILERFDYMYELMIMKERIDHGIEKAKNDDDWGAYANLLKQHQAWADRMKDFQESEKKQKLPVISITFSADPELLGVNPEMLEEWRQRVKVIKERSKKKFKDFEIQEADVIE